VKSEASFFRGGEPNAVSIGQILKNSYRIPKIQPIVARY
jgi:hypothetical protein